VFFDEFKNCRKFSASKSIILRQLDLRFKPELCFAVASLNVDMNLSGEEEGSEAEFSEKLSDSRDEACS
jgi:hypothetical protein